MNLITRTVVRACALLAVASVSLAGAQPAAAGCLKEYGQCGDCAQEAMVDALFDLDVGGAIDAYVDAMDCDIDLFHCILFDSHHDYSCGQ